MINNAGDKGSPYFKPLEDLKKPCDFPLITTEYQLLAINLHTKSMMISENPNCLSTLVRKIQETLLLAFSISNFTTTFTFLFLLPIFLIISWASRTFSAIFLSLMNLDWFWDIIFTQTMLILSCTTLEMILLVKELRLIGLRYMKRFTISLLGTNIKLVWVMNLVNSWPQNKALTSLIMSSFIMSQ